MFEVEKLGDWLHGLRVATPQASQRAALEENSGPDPRSVADSESLYVENTTRYPGLFSDFGITQRQTS